MSFQIVRNDITKMKVDAIVDTANPMPGYGAGIDTAVYEAAGIEELLAKRHEIGLIDRGQAVITDGYRLPAKYIIHTVGTAWRGGGAGEEDIIRKCYKAVFKLAVEKDIESLAVPLLASGCYGFPKGIALRIALSEIENFLSAHDMEIYLVVFDDKSFSLSEELYGDIDEYINDNYVDEKTLEEYRGAYYSRADRDFGMPTVAQSMPSARNAIGLAGGLSSKRQKRKALKESAVFSDEVLEDLDISEDAMPCVAPMAAKSLDDAVKNLDKSFMELVFSFADERGLTDVEVQRRANLDRKAFSKLKCGTTKNPSKSTALALAVALNLSLDDTKDLLSRAGLALSPCSKQDIIVQYFIEREAYDIYEINIALFEHGEPTLGTQTA